MNNISLYIYIYTYFIYVMMTHDNMTMKTMMILVVMMADGLMFDVWCLIMLLMMVYMMAHH